MRVCDTADFVKKASAIHRRKYDYSKSTYSGKLVKVEIICKIHGSFWQTPEAHYSRGCPRCSIDKMGREKMLTAKEFMRRARDVHGRKYGYRKLSYRGKRTRVCITCPIHGDFYQFPPNHTLLKRGCPACSGLERYTRDMFIRKAERIYGKKYDYDGIVVRGCFDIVSVRCRKHGLFRIRANTFLGGKSQCPSCKKDELALDFLRRAEKTHGSKYNYDAVEYGGSRRKVVIVCPRHGQFRQTPSTHANGAGCPTCWKERRTRNTKQFIRDSRLVHGRKYGYSKADYRVYKKISIICPKHGVFLQLAQNHLSGQGCPECKCFKGEGMVSKILRKMGIQYEGQKTFRECRDKKYLPFDFYIPSKKMLIEFDGIQHFYPTSFSHDKSAVFREKCFRVVRRHDKIRNRFAREYGYRLVRVPYWRVNLKNGVERFLKKYLL